MQRTQVDTQRLAKKTAGGPNVTLGSVSDRLIERIEHHSLNYVVVVDGHEYKLSVSFFDVAKPSSHDDEVHERSATINIRYIGEIPEPEAREAIKLFITHNLKLAQAVTVYDTSDSILKNKDDALLSKRKKANK